jgi:gamma-glutamyltranspeptidase/glutathione hydrolase
MGNWKANKRGNTPYQVKSSNQASLISSFVVNFSCYLVKILNPIMLRNLNFSYERLQGVIAAGHQKTAEAGIEMLRSGGNAFDAAIASILASFVTETGMTSGGGGGFLLAHTAASKNICYDFFTQTPGRKKGEKEINFYPVDVDFGGAVQEFHIGLGSMAVPGNIAGVFEIHKKLGKLPFHLVAEPAIFSAKKGVEITEYQNYLLTTILKPIMLATPEGRDIYAPKGKQLQTGDTIFMSDFAETLSYLVERGPREFYEGEIAKKLVKDCQERGGYLTHEDLKNYRVIERKPLTIDYRGNTLLTNPPPSSGGTLIAFALEMLSLFDLEKVGFGTAKHLQILAAAMGVTNLARKAEFDGNIYRGDVADRFLASESLDKFKKQLTETVNKLGSTTHISVIDSDGNAASVTTSNGEGSGYIIPGTGIMLNNMLGEEDLNPHGFHQWRENQRISSMMAPTIVLKNGRPEIVLGSGGSNRIRTAILQVISNIIDFKMSVKKAVDSPRIHWENNKFHLEPGFAEEEIDKLKVSEEEELILWSNKNMFFGGVNAVFENAEDLISGAGDGRRGGASLSEVGNRQEAKGKSL